MTDAEWEYLHQRRFDVRLRAATNRIYQQRRAALMDMRERLVKASSLIAGSAAFVSVTHPDVIRIGALVIFAGSALSLVFGWGMKARDAADRASKWATLEGEIEAKGARGFAESDIDRWAASCSETERGEPAANRRLFERAYRQACQSLGASPTPGGPQAWLPVIFVP